MNTTHTGIGIGVESANVPAILDIPERLVQTTIHATALAAVEIDIALMAYVLATLATLG